MVIVSIMDHLHSIGLSVGIEVRIDVRLFFILACSHMNNAIVSLSGPLAVFERPIVSQVCTSVQHELHGKTKTPVEFVVRDGRTGHLLEERLLVFKECGHSSNVNIT